jgi:UDP-N-acetylmuramoyl-tripeptide--D-alanyl-D-alanine ligase
VRFKASELPGRAVGPETEVEGAVIDSRRVRGGELFVPVVAGRDGHDFIDHALAAGAAAHFTAREPLGGAVTSVLVEDTVAALADLARLARSRLGDQVVGVTGSSGKTSTKDLLASVLAVLGPCAANERSFNNELGVPLTLVNAPADAATVVVEMGARGAGHIRALCEIARPTVGVVTNVSLSHTEFLGSIEGVAAAKSELVASLPPSGTAVLNAGDPRVAAMAGASQAAVVTFGVGAGDVRASGVSLDGELRASFTLDSPWGRAAVRLELRGAHQVANAAAAAAAALSLGADLEAVAAGLARARGSAWRMEVSRGVSGVLVVNDAYNANPASVDAALRSLASIEGPGRRVAVLGPMLELGDVSAAEHRRAVAVAAELGLEVLVVGTDEYGRAPVGLDEVGAALAALGEGDAVLVKASRAAGLERLAAALVAGDRQW